jgi:aspartate-semialdehyde dehydrogenase
MPLERDSHRIVIAGASSVVGGELKSLLEESRFAASDFRLLDEEMAAGTLTEAAGEAVVIQPVEETSFDRARFVFFTGSSEFTHANLDLARRSGAVIVDLSGFSATLPEGRPWFRGLDALRAGGTSKGIAATAPNDKSRLTAIPSAAAEAIVRLTLGLRDVGLRSITTTVLQPVSAWGKPAIEELETQTSHLLSFQTPGKQLFDAQIAFSMLDRFGPLSRYNLSSALANIRSEVQACLRGNTVVPAIQLVHVPVFYGTTFSISADLDTSADAARIQSSCKAAGFSMGEVPDSPNNLSVAEQSTIQLAQPGTDAAKPGTWWFWGAADNIRLPAWNAVKLAESFTE